MTGRVTTRAGRKIRHVAPGHVVDVESGWHAYQIVPGVWGVYQDENREGDRLVLVRSLDMVLKVLSVHHARAEAVCTFVHALLALRDDDGCAGCLSASAEHPCLGHGCTSWCRTHYMGWFCEDSP